MKKFLRMFILFTFTTFLYSNISLASCNAYTIGGAITVSPPTQKVEGGVTAGTKIYESVYTNSNAYLITENCLRYIDKPIVGHSTGLKTDKGCDIYTTNVEGIGYSFYNDRETLICMGEVHSLAANDRIVEFGNVFQLYVIGPVESGTISPGKYIQQIIDGINAFSINLDSTIVQGVTCTVEQSNIAIPLGEFGAETFTNIGSTTLEKSFQFGLTCDSDANVTVSLNGTQNTDTAETSVLALTGTGSPNTATGVGVQFLYNETPLAIGDAIPLKTTTKNVRENYTFSARYYQTKSTVSGGDANATASLTIKYQ